MTAARAIMAEALPPVTADGWIMLLPHGAIAGRDGRSFRVANAQEVIARSRPAAGGPSELPVDYEHQSETPTAGEGGPKPAAGWIVDLMARSDGIYGKVRWTDRAAKLIADREYRFVSPVFNHTVDRTVTRILGAGLTHRPNLELRALSSEDHMDPTPEDVVRIAKALGLDAGATADDMLAAIRDLAKRREEDGEEETAENRAAPDPARYVPVEAVQAMLRKRAGERRALHSAEAEHRVAAALDAGHITPALKPWALALCRQDPASFDRFVGSSPAPFAHLVEPVLAGRQPPGGGGSAAGRSEDERAICRQLGIERIAH